MRRIIFLAFVTIAFNSCITENRLVKEYNGQLVPVSNANLNGIYSNIKLDSTRKLYPELWQILSNSYKGKVKNNRVPDSSSIKLYFLDENYLNVKLFNSDNELLDELILKGKYHSSYFSVKRKYFLLPIPFLFVLYDTKSLIGISKDNSLVLLHGQNDYGWILFMAGGQTYISNQHYQKLEVE